jgi:hypothetical protein
MTMARPRGRPKKANSTNHQIGVRCNTRELEGWKKAAAHAGFGGNVSGWVRAVLNISAAMELTEDYPELSLQEPSPSPPSSSPVMLRTDSSLARSEK